MRSSLRVAWLFAWIVGLACGPETDAPSLDDRVFLSQSVTEGGAPRALVDGTQLRLTFFESPRVGASAGCNSLQGSYAIDGGSFVVTDAGQTAIGCDAALHDQDDWYFAFVLSSPSIVIDGDSLVLDKDGTRIEYLDQEVATPDATLTSRTWTVEAIIEGDLAQLAQWPAPATLVFGADHRVTIDTSCNSGSGTFAVAGTGLAFSDVSVTERGCTDPQLADLERVMLGLLLGPQPVTWEITVDRLSLRGDEFGLDLVSDG